MIDSFTIQQSFFIFTLNKFVPDNYRPHQKNSSKNQNEPSKELIMKLSSKMNNDATWTIKFNIATM